MGPSLCFQRRGSEHGIIFQSLSFISGQDEHLQVREHSVIKSSMLNNIEEFGERDCTLGPS